MYEVWKGLCHGGDRRADEPVSMLAPLLRTLAWGAVCLTAATTLVVAAAYALTGDDYLVLAIMFVQVIGLFLAIALAFVSLVVRPRSVSLRAARRP